MSEPAETPTKTRAAAGTGKLLSAACILGLVGIAFSLLNFLWPTPLAFTLFMIVGQGSFGAAMLLYAVAILRDLKRQKVL